MLAYDMPLYRPAIRRAKSDYPGDTGLQFQSLYLLFDVSRKAVSGQADGGYSR